MARSRLAAMLALVAALVALAAAAYLAVVEFPEGPANVALLAAGFALIVWGLVRRGWRRRAAVLLGGLAILGSLVLAIAGGRVLEGLVAVAALGVGVMAAGRAFATHGDLAPAEPPRRAVLFMNPKSGGGKAERFHLADEARARGIEPVVLGPGDDLEALVRDALERGADGLAAAGGDGTQAIVAAHAAERGLPFACIPAGTRNHLALDLGVDRGDAVGALDAFVDGAEEVVDLAEVNGRVFVNNVSLGFYAEAVQREAYRDAKVRTLLDTVPDALGPEATAPELRWADPDTGATASSPAVLVSNGRYRLGRSVGSGTRPTMQAGLLGVAVVNAERNHRPHLPWHEWGAREFVLEADAPVHAGIDGEAAELAPPLRFRARPGALRVRVARSHPGASPSAAVPDGLRAGLAGLMRIAVRG